MANEQTSMERAFEIAKSGSVRTVTDLKRQMRREGHVGFDMHLTGSPTLGRQLTELIRQSASPA